MTQGRGHHPGALQVFTDYNTIPIRLSQHCQVPTILLGSQVQAQNQVQALQSAWIRFQDRDIQAQLPSLSQIKRGQEGEILGAWGGRQDNKTIVS